jgi:hypothetical protein
MSSASSTVQKRPRDVEDKAEEDMIAAIIAYSDFTERCKCACEMVQRQCEEALNLYVKARGGETNVMVFEIPTTGFRPELICEKSFIQEFRFSHAQMDRVVLGLLSVGFPKVVKTPARDSCPLHEAMCMLCMKYAWPTRLGSMVKVFGVSVSKLSRVVSAMRRLLHKAFGSALNHAGDLSLRELLRFSAAIEAKSGIGGRFFFGFVDGTVRPIPKPSHLQGVVYNGKDRIHALKFQSVVTPDGMLHQLTGPWPGARHDMHMLRQSSLLPYVCGLPTAADGTRFSIYADCGYSESPGIVAPYFDGAVNVVHEAWNQAMASSRIAVEWGFGDIVLSWSHLDMVRQHQLLSNRKIGQVYLVAGLMTNFLNCFKPNRGSQYFNVEPPTFEIYLQRLMRHSAFYQAVAELAQGEGNE